MGTAQWRHALVGDHASRAGTSTLLLCWLLRRPRQKHDFIVSSAEAFSPFEHDCRVDQYRWLSLGMMCSGIARPELFHILNAFESWFKVICILACSCEKK